MRLFLWYVGLLGAVAATPEKACYFPDSNDTEMSSTSGFVLIKAFPGTVTMIGCLDDFSVCNYEIRCKSKDLNWTPETRMRNPADVHYYLCQNGVYTDFVTDKVYENLIEGCEPIEEEGNHGNRESTPTESTKCIEEMNETETGIDFFVDCEGESCFYRIKCKDGFSWVAKSELAEQDVIRYYGCKNGVYIDIKTGEQSNNLNVQCQQDEDSNSADNHSNCPRIVKDSHVEVTENVLVRRNCSLNPARNEQICVFEIKCAPFDEDSEVHIHESVESGQFLCNEDTGEWVNLRTNKPYNSSNNNLRAYLTLCTQKDLENKTTTTASPVTNSTCGPDVVTEAQTTTIASLVLNSTCEDDVFTEVQSSMYYLHTCTAQPARSITNCTTTVYCDPMDKNAYTTRSSQKYYFGLAVCDPETKEWCGYPIHLKEVDPKTMLKQLCGIEDNVTTTAKTTQKPTTTTVKATTPSAVSDKDCIIPKDDSNFSVTKKTTERTKLIGITVKCNTVTLKNDSMKYDLECDRSLGVWKNSADNVTCKDPQEICANVENMKESETIVIPIPAIKKEELACQRNLTLPNIKIEEICSAQMCLYQLECNIGYNWIRAPENRESKRFYSCLGNNTYRNQRTKSSISNIDEECVLTDPVEKEMIMVKSPK